MKRTAGPIRTAARKRRSSRASRQRPLARAGAATSTGRILGNRAKLRAVMAEIQLESLTKVYPDGTKAVSELDVEIADGEFIVLVGPSGCGKTSALRMVAGLEPITSGAVKIGGRVVNDLPPKSPRTLSGGQRQRVAMGRAIVREPQAFLMDEPLSNLDAKLRVEMRAEIARIQRDLEVTTIYVTHDQVEAMTMGDRVAVMNAGHLLQVDTPQVLYERPVNLFVGGFIGSPAMNLIQATL